MLNDTHELTADIQDEHNQDWQTNVYPPDRQNPTPAAKYNLVVIGGGSAGLVAAAGAAGLGAKVALIERKFMGGDCLNTGCVPSKTIIRSGHAMAYIKEAAEYGIDVTGEVEANFGAVMERVRRVRATISHHDSVKRYEELGIDVFLGEGHFIGPNQIAVGEAVLNFKKALIATGARGMHLPIPGLEETGHLTNETVWSLTERPQRLAVIGAGPIGSELAQAMRRLGSEVTVFDILPQVLGREDRDAADIVERVMREDGVELVLEVNLKQIEKRGADKVITFEHQGGEQTLVNR